jgi:hypothetical protein
VLATLQIIALLLVALAMAPAVAHALELQGKKKLPRETYLAVQAIYYPGFTVVGGFSEVVGALATLALLFVVPRGTEAFWHTVSAFVALAIMHGIFWVFTQPVNKVWLRNQNLTGAAASFFRMRTSSHGSRDFDWSALRDRWEYSHVARAVMALIALVLLASALAAT